MKLLDIATRITEAPLNSWPGVLALTVVMLLFALAGHRLGAHLLRRITRPYVTMGMVVRFIDRPAQLAVTILLLQLVWWNAADDLVLINPLRRLSGLVLIGSLTWLAVRSVAALVQGVMILNPLDTEDNLRTRALHTQVHVLGRCVMGTIVVIGVGAMLMTIPNVRQIGTSLLASAGVAGLVAGIAARPVLGNLIAGLQIAISQPVRIDDVVVIQGEWGRVEAITGSYIAVRIWDQRRLIVPLQWFIENSFQNWTRNSAEIIGSVFLWVDFRLPLDPVRHELVRLCEAASEWDGRVQVLQVTDTSERAMQLRILVSSPDSPRNFDLRCKVREGLLDFIQREFPACLPRERTEWHASDAASGTMRGTDPLDSSARDASPFAPSRHEPDLGASAAAASRLSSLPSSPKV
ncbi:mechanosensitive ion channel family protein [Robbsia sp. Bb-Pol-6]|uniref:Mechanosensitive ion channel family protein n=1 Tax=Robbsia betulipollinis TaxID=2981849 RepID=A0ABT3ZNK5_9BURK|nr:mechanosensitive ion channel family protein [Robbsia betulipollinis]MCY0388111.1 mechanosensitive ion channel family protein [Robbsia betulipollinis]